MFVYHIFEELILLIIMSIPFACTDLITKQAMASFSNDIYPNILILLWLRRPLKLFWNPVVRLYEHLKKRLRKKALNKIFINKIYLIK